MGSLLEVSLLKNTIHVINIYFLLYNRTSFYGLGGNTVAFCSQYVDMTKLSPV